MVGIDAARVRRDVGPMAWCVLEVLACSPVPGDDDTIVLASVRSLASQLGVSKNTVHRALVKLRSAGLLDGGQLRAESGRLEAGFCRLRVPADVLAIAGRAPLAGFSGEEGGARSASLQGPDAVETSARRGRSLSRQSASGFEQLSLLPGV